jgi:hypothetical protein
MPAYDAPGWSTPTCDVPGGHLPPSKAPVLSVPACDIPDWSVPTCDVPGWYMPPVIPWLVCARL